MTTPAPAEVYAEHTVAPAPDWADLVSPASALDRSAAMCVAELTRLWVNALRVPCGMTMGIADLDRFLSTLAHSLVAAFTAHPPEVSAFEAAGAALVRLRVPAADLLPSSLKVLAALPDIVRGEAACGRSGEDAVLVDQMTTAFAVGFVQALQDRVLSEQESIQLAARRALQEAQRGHIESQRRLQAVFDAAAIAIAICDLEGCIIEANSGMAAMAGRDNAALAGLSVLELLHPDDRASTAADIERLVSGDQLPFSADRRLDRPGAATSWVMLSLSLVAQPEGYLVVVAEDITERHHLQQSLEHQALHDALTGLPNRTLLHRRLAEAQRDAAPQSHIGLCFIDLDDFKAVNDTLGHAVGDRLLIAVAERLRAACGDNHVVARVGGDEFVVIIPASRGPIALGELAQRILTTLSDTTEVDGYRLTVSASIGIIEQPAATANPEQMLRAADATLYLAKADGRGRWAMFDPRRNAEQRQRYELLAQLPEALHRGEFYVLYQPIVTLGDSTVCGVEALLRWAHPQLGTVGPSDFVPIAEHTGLIVPLGRWVLNEACAHAAQWRAKLRRPPFVSVNVSLRQCGDPGFASDVLAALDNTGCPRRACSSNSPRPPSCCPPTRGYPPCAVWPISGCG